MKKEMFFNIPLCLFAVQDAACCEAILAIIRL